MGSQGKFSLQLLKNTSFNENAPDAIVCSFATDLVWRGNSTTHTRSVQAPEVDKQWVV